MSDTSSTVQGQPPQPPEDEDFADTVQDQGTEVTQGHPPAQATPTDPLQAILQLQQQQMEQQRQQMEVMQQQMQTLMTVNMQLQQQLTTLLTAQAPAQPQPIAAPP